MREYRRDIVGGFIFSSDDKLLLGHNYKGGVYSDVWSVPGGGIEELESKRNALLREMGEETGLDISNALVTETDGKHYDSREKTLRDTGEVVLIHMTFYDFVIRFPLQASEIVVHAEDDWHEPHWFSLEELTEIELAPPTAERLRKLGYL